MLSLIIGGTYQTLLQNNYVSVLFSLVCKDFQMIPTGLHVCRENILISPSPPRELYVGTTQQHQTTLNRHFQEFHKVSLNEKKTSCVLWNMWYCRSNGLGWKLIKAKILSVAVLLFDITGLPGTFHVRYCFLGNK